MKVPQFSDNDMSSDAGLVLAGAVELPVATLVEQAQPDKNE